MAAGLKSNMRATPNVWLPINKLFVDESYGRPFAKRKITAMLKDFDPDAIGEIFVSERGDGMYAILDGQHRVRAVRSVWGDDEKVPCLVYHGLTVPEEARLYVKFNDDRTKPLPLNLFQSKMVGGDKTAMEINEICNRHGFKVQSGHGRVIACVQSMTRVYENAPDKKTLDKALSIIVQAWGVDQQNVPGPIVESIAVVLSRNPGLNVNRLVTSLSGTLPKQLLMKARMAVEFSAGTRDLNSHVAALIVDLYNKGLRTDTRRIPTWEARSAKQYWMPESEYRARVAE